MASSYKKKQEQKRFNKDESVIVKTKISDI